MINITQQDPFNIFYFLTQEFASVFLCEYILFDENVPPALYDIYAA